MCSSQSAPSSQSLHTVRTPVVLVQVNSCTEHTVIHGNPLQFQQKLRVNLTLDHIQSLSFLILRFPACLCLRKTGRGALLK